MCHCECSILLRRNLGDVNTNHHAVTLRVKSLLDSCNEGLDEHCNSGQNSTYVDELGENEVNSGMQVSNIQYCDLSHNIQKRVLQRDHQFIPKLAARAGMHVAGIANMASMLHLLL